MVPRRRLDDRLRGALDRRLTLVSAPAGFGKSTQLSSCAAAWATARDVAVAWVSLDGDDNDPGTFWAYVAASLDRSAPAMDAAGALSAEPGRPIDEQQLTALLNALVSLDSEVVLVLDDYHAIVNPQLHEQVGYLVDHLPPGAHVIVSTRADPSLPLSRLRARGELVEVRTADLRFTADETARYLATAVDAEMSPADATTLADRTEGWAAALQLAALSMRGRDDISGFVGRFAGDDRYVVDYLAEEVLARESADVRDFLLSTSVLDRLTGALCDAVTGRRDGSMMLETLERANLFVVPLDDRREWYRYHHLFADVLQARLLAERSDGVPGLHRRASDWYERNGDPARAIRHAFASGDVERAADLVEVQIPEARRARHEAIMLGWLSQLPQDLIDRRPALAIIQVGALVATGDIAAAEGRLSQVEQALPGSDADGYMAANVALYRAAFAQAHGDADGTVEHARRAVALAPPDDDVTRAGGAGFLGITLWGAGDLVGAEEAWEEGAAGLGRTGHLADVLGMTIALGDIRTVLGRLRQARRGFEDALALAEKSGRGVVRGTADMHVGLAETLLESGDLQGAAEHLATAAELPDAAGLAQLPYRSRVARAGLRVAEGDLASAAALLDEAERAYVGDFFPPWRPVAAVRARVWLAGGDVDRARAWARDTGLAADDELTFLREYEHLTLVRILRADGPAAVAGLLSRLLSAAEAWGRIRSVIECLTLQAIALHTRDDEAALDTLDRAMELAEPEGIVRVFLDEGRPMASLLQTAGKRGVRPSYVQHLFASGTQARHEPHVAQPLLDPLSERELDVLRLLDSDLDGPDIARHLVVSLNTVRTHTKSIYAKLGVNSRRAAVMRAHELGLLTRN
ncbi:MAG: helix-turn-helix transcriptional regulator [Nocardioides sp.]|nr:helix-turn-helix transcriptional regulator [Nocardioides sp.]